MSFDSEDVPLDYQFFIGAVTFLLKRIEPDPVGPIPKFEQSFVQKGQLARHEVRKHAEWLLKMTQRCCFSLTSFNCALIYIERLRRDRKLTLYESTWRSTWVAMSVISEKRWEDNYIHPGHIHNTYGSRHTALEQQHMQINLCTALGWNLAIDLQDYRAWTHRLRNDYDVRQVMSACHFQRVFIQRPIPNLKKARKSENTPSTTADSEPGSDSQWQRRDMKQSISQKHHDAPSDAHKSHHSFAMAQQQLGYTTMTPRAHGRQFHGPHGGAATCRREYHTQSSATQLNCDWVPQQAPDLRPGATRQNPDYCHVDLRLTDLTTRSMQELNQFRATPWHNNGMNADHHPLGVYQDRHRIAAQHRIATQHRASAMGASAYDHGSMSSWTARAPQYDANLQYTRSGVVAWG
eukprot:gnl/MRDRNA2_/MRDRNA2_92112_c0_seq1.p1 gnl/MRDRNA2_/MRDRNA2_92112_c0~~gnl/MRDRNA2_/MRDRNA2_92112_c0_seq1.p1  ORF type:complete len:406 (-),score=47.77 gnl/MRDRNA2_/MRDRNA2_92112_c0_seq1:147-1364(-)